MPEIAPIGGTNNSPTLGARTAREYLATGQAGRIGPDRRFRGLIEETPPIVVAGPFASEAVPEMLEELHARELKTIGRVAVPRDLEKPYVGLAQLRTNC